jgi:hypothetical protein
MNQIIKHVLIVSVMLLPFSVTRAQNTPGFKHYSNYQAVQATLKSLQSKNPGAVALHTIAQSPGKRDVVVIEVGKDLSDGPAIFVAANMEGITHLATEGALRLVQFLLDSAQYRSAVKWYILPVGNPDAAQHVFGAPRLFSTLNGLEINIDVDDQTSEDGFEDLDKDGFITTMRVKAPDGNYRISDEDPRLLVKADPLKGEKGIYKLYTEGIDNDGDGQYNEDQPGGINPGINFPHDFQHFNKEAGLWPGSAPETFGVMKFIYDHPEIAMTITLGESNLLLDLPQEARTDFDPNRIRIPERFARQSGLSPTQTYTMDQLIQAFSNRFPGMEITENMILGQLSLGPERSFRKNDILIYENLAKSYKAALTAGKLSTSLMAPEKPRNGSFELWSYFHLGVPSIALSLWEPEVKKDTTAVAKGASTGQGAPSGMGRMAAAGPGAAAQEKKPAPEKQLLDYLDQHSLKGFTEWKAYSHPQLGEVEIGGIRPYVQNTPQAEQVDQLLNTQIPFIASLSQKIPNILISEEKVTSLGAGVYRLEIFVENKAQIPYPTDMGLRNQQPAPVILILEGKDIRILEGLERTPINSLAGNQVRKLTWLVQTGKPGELTAKLESPVIINQVRKISLGK